MIRGLLSDDKFRFYDNTNNNGNLIRKNLLVEVGEMRNGL